ncbi:Eco57I restriction-modification methylase domain-containing protein [Actinoalloteichus sp. GBA129-24]|uniref:Eco57I restriction-modification methylase domain-containing protein n=1 Tax=Actinoalloteichus sp. GBA129-24 TaxID=1612551 RepID=UPI0009503860|nr:type IIL restriction-modification enzyme MmeI [Actinoalloteichus sp. GBA129-24]APU22204.1 Methyltransferase domain [Actinoalloteichus sp. GBA129-24]
MNTRFRGPRPVDGAAQHRDWLSLVEVNGPFLSLPVLIDTWPTLDALDKTELPVLRQRHTRWQADGASGAGDWIDYVLRDLLGWGDALHTEELDALRMEVGEHDTTLTPDFVLAEPGAEPRGEQVRLIGLRCAPGQVPTSRIAGSPWAATPVDRVATLCRKHGVELGLVTDGRWWALVWAPRGGATGTAVFDAVPWAEAAERQVVRAFRSLLCRRRFFGVPDGEQLIPLLVRSKDNQEDITDRLGVQVRQAVELLVAAVGRAELEERRTGEVEPRSAQEVYRASVMVMMRIVFLLFAEERGLLPADNDLYMKSYSAGGLRAELAERARDSGENVLEHGYAAWHRLLALFEAVYSGVEHPRLTMHAHDGSIFDPAGYATLPRRIDDRTVLHMLSAVQEVTIGRGRKAETRSVSFRSLDVEQIGYVYEGLLSFEGLRADEVVIGLIGKEGMEEEVALSDLEELAAQSEDVSALAAMLAELFKASKIGSAAALAKKLAPVTGVAREEQRKRLLAVNGKDHELAERLLPFAELIRPDLRGLPTVILPGALFVTESSLRKNTGTHYTPRFLAEEVVEGALQPLVYTHGPLQTADESTWQPKTSAELLRLRVADIAMGSAAFLVAAARYLGDRLVEAWTREGHELVRDYRAEDHVTDPDSDPVRITARRLVIEHCLYGADINEMAVEMAKLSLWLVSMDATRPFTFLDDRLVAGDSLLGITSLDQLEYLHLDPEKGREIHEDDVFGWTAGVRELVAEIAAARRRLTEIELGSDPLAALAEKRRLLAEAARRTEQVRLFADLTVGAALSRAGKGDRAVAAASVAAAQLAAGVAAGEPGALEKAEQQRSDWLATDQVPGSFDREPIHWPLVFPEVFEGGGFDAVVGNPPFLGGKKISGASGGAYREYLVADLASGRKGNADLIAYFFLRTHSILGDPGQSGLIGTNTLAQGETREVGLDQIVDARFSIRAAVTGRPWPSKSAAIEYSVVWLSRSSHAMKFERWLDGRRVDGITSSLAVESRGSLPAFTLAQSAGRSFQGSTLLGTGFTMAPAIAAEIVKVDPASSDVLFPYLNGKDLNSSPCGLASRWAVNFRDWSEARAQSYESCYQWLVDHVKSDRLASGSDYAAVNWWRYWRPRGDLYAAINQLDRIVVITRVSSTVVPVIVSARQVISDAIVVFATDDTAMLALLSSAPHYWWAVARASSMKADLRYTPSDVFETLPLPTLTQEMRDLGDRLDTFRRSVMLGRQLGLTKLYNQVFSADYVDDDLTELRRIHRAIDEATVRAYGWDDLLDQLDHGFHPAGKDTRYTIGPAAQREVLDRLLELNHERYAQEVAEGLHDKKSAKQKQTAKAKKQAPPQEEGLF